ncbi:ShlB/FhaC/HecB family hemolysin secretion/activation protein [Sphingomonas sp.]|uniref:ShlB/FhaC/HecB family hemolysin secretion/activation protein n=1 Tax=Sphingomonas sp. TaxID=28214 RepID=UPI00286DCA34|nr:ShlB/FhaC/HecB family hemolysin secretion/activation protein [Sphingomonas sp.]
MATPTAGQAQSVAPTREEVTRPPPQPEPPRPPRLDVEGGIERAPCALDTPENQAIRFTLRDVQFEGLRGLAPGDLTPAYADLVGQEQPVAAICEIRDRAATILRGAGYIASVEVPEQRIAEGTVRFKVLMAKLVQVRVRGDAGRAEQTIAGYLGRLTDQEVFNRYEAERYLLLASDLPGYNVRLTLRPAGTIPGEVVGDVTVLRLAGVLDANVQNYGSQELGRWGGLLRAQLFGLTGLGDRTTVALFETFNLKEQRTIQVGHDFRLGSEGLTLSGNFTYAWARPDIAGGADVRATTMFATAEVSYPFIRRQSNTVRGAVGFDLVDQDVEIEDADLTRDRLRVAFARLTADAVSLDFTRRGSSLAEPLWRVSGLIELRRGLDIFDATDCGETGSECLGPGEVLPSRTEADGTATVVRSSIYGEYRPARLVTLALGVRGQWADDPLLSFEEFSAGNYTVGRGYDPGSLLGDRGIGFQAEVRLGSLVPTGPRVPAFEGFVFFDHARINNLDRLLDNSDFADRLSSVGGGLRTVFRGLNLDATYAIPLKRVGPLDEKPDHRLLISLTTRLWPWSFQ